MSMHLHNELHNKGNSKNTTITILNGNSFFSLDNSDNEQIPNTYSLHNNFTTRFAGTSKLLFNNQSGSNQNNNNVKSAQYYRKSEHQQTLYKINLPPSTGIQLRDQTNTIKRQTLSEFRNKMKIGNHIVNLHHRPQYHSERGTINHDKQKAMISFTIDPEAVNEDKKRLKKYLKSSERRANSFSQNYKNKKKLLDRIGNKRIKQLSKTLRWDSKPQDLIQKQIKSKQWSPYTGKLGNRKRDSLLESIEGSKIKYCHQQSKPKQSSRLGKLQII